MDLEQAKQSLAASHGFEENIGIELVSTPEPDVCVACMHVDDRNRQPFGYLSGGASLALAETLAGVGSYGLCPDCTAVGLSVSGNHVHAAKVGETVTARAQILHQGKQTHVWKVDVTNENGDLISTVTVTNFIQRP